MYKKEKKSFYINLDVKDVTQNKTFWKYIKPCFSNHNQGKAKITLVQGNDIIQEDQDVAETFNDFFKTAV